MQEPAERTSDRGEFALHYWEIQKNPFVAFPFVGSRVGRVGPAFGFGFDGMVAAFGVGNDS